MIIWYVIYVGIDLGMDMITYNEPYITTLATGFTNLDKKYEFVNLYTKPIFEITEMRDGKIFQTVKLDRESR